MLLVEDEEDMRYLVRVILEFAEDPIEVTAEACDVADGVSVWRALRPHITVVDYRLPGGSGLDVAEQILREDPDAPIVLFSAFLDSRTVERADQLGVRACVSKDRVQELPALLRRHIESD
ncbi:MAG TPA: response regulator transcription factor [Acidimicrobiales bacterium]|nr:response regulator transcription factor [Acidimicrobiales bacterium]